MIEVIISINDAEMEHRIIFYESKYGSSRYRYCNNFNWDWRLDITQEVVGNPYEDMRNRSIFVWEE